MAKSELYKCDVCGFNQTAQACCEDLVIHTHYGNFCIDCYQKYEPRLKELCDEICKKEIEKIVEERIAEQMEQQQEEELNFD